MTGGPEPIYCDEAGAPGVSRGRLCCGRHEPHTRAHILRGAVFVATIMSLCLYSIYLGFVHVLPALAPQTFGLQWWLHFGAFAVLAANFFYHYFACVLTDPITHVSTDFSTLVSEARARGAVAARATAATEPAGGRPEDGRLYEGDVGGWLSVPDPHRWGVCAHSGSVKPPRAHFCKVTGRLVLEMDHYCVWVFNTIGYGNYRHFVLAIFWQTVGGVFGLLETMCVYSRSPAYEPPTPDPAEPFLHFLMRVGIVGPVGPLFFLCLVTAASSAVVGPFVCWHLYLSAHAMTTIEQAGWRIRAQADDSFDLNNSPYSLGSPWYNCCERLGLATDPPCSSSSGPKIPRSDDAPTLVRAAVTLILPWLQSRPTAAWIGAGNCFYVARSRR
jgi:hypothetical protein